SRPLPSPASIFYNVCTFPSKHLPHARQREVMQGPPLQDLPEQVITLPEELPACCEHLRASPCIGFDTEFVGEDTYHPSLCLLQVATPEQLFLIDPLTVGPLDLFWAVIADPAHRVIVHAGREEIRLCHLGSGKSPGDLFDLQIAAG